MTVILGMGALLLLLLLAEAVLLARARRRVPCRIVVTGTRGKSSLVRILTAGLRVSEPATLGKSTGDLPLVLLPGGAERRLVRRGPARLHEQAKLLLDCARRGVRCLVLESMTISPETMQAEMRLIRPTLAVVVNVRDDHRETLGEDPDAQRQAYLQALPGACPWLTGDSGLRRLAEASADHPSPIRFVAGAEGKDVAGELLALAKAVLEELGRNSDEARRVMAETAARMAPQRRVVLFRGTRVGLLDAFSVNDPQSLAAVWNRWRRQENAREPWPVLLATRADRPLRTRQFCAWLAERDDVGTVHVAGDHRHAAARLLRRRGVVVEDLGAEPDASAAGDPETGRAVDGLLVGMGNAHGAGLRLRAAAEEAVA